MTRIMDKIKELPRSGGALGRDYPSRCEWCEVEIISPMFQPDLGGYCKQDHVFQLVSHAVGC